MNQLRQLRLASAVGTTSLAFVLAATSVRAAIVAYEDFESYADGSTFIGGTGGTGWAQPWIGNTTTGTPVQLASSGKIAGYGKSLELGGTADNRGIGVRQFPAQTGDVYIGMVLQTTNGWDADFWQIYVNNTYATADSTTPSFAAGLFNEATTNPYFVRKGSATAGVGSTNKSTVSHTSVNNDIHTFVAKFSKSTGLAADLYDQASLWIDQPTEGTPTAVLGAADIGTAAPNSATISALHMRISSLEGTDRVYLDNITVATTFAEALAVPEPASAWLVFFAGITMAIGVGSSTRSSRRRHQWSA